MAPPGGASVARAAIASLNPQTGALTNAVTDTFAGIGTKGTTSVRRIDVTPAGDRLVAHRQLQLRRRPAALADRPARHQRTDVVVVAVADHRSTPHSTRPGTRGARKSFPSYMRDVAYSTDGSYFIVVTTGAYRSGRLCDSQSRWETDGGANQLPTWVDYTGGDTSTASAPAPTARSSTSAATSAG